MNATKAWEGETAGDGERGSTLTQIWQVQTTEPAREDSLQVLRARGLPQLGMAHPSDATVVVLPRRCRRLAPCLFEVTVPFGTPDPNRPALPGGGGDETKPWDQPVEWSVGQAVSVVTVDRDHDDDPITNSADEPIEPGVQEEHADTVLHAIRNEEEYDLRLAEQLSRSTNSDMFLGCGRGMVRCRMTGELARHEGLVYWRVRYEFRIRRDGWKHRLLDRGYREKLAAAAADGTPTYKNMTDGNGQQVTQPANLDGAGRKLATGKDPAWLTWTTLDEIGFAQLHLDPPPHLKLGIDTEDQKK